MRVRKTCGITALRQAVSLLERLRHQVDSEDAQEIDRILDNYDQLTDRQGRHGWAIDRAMEELGTKHPFDFDDSPLVSGSRNGCFVNVWYWVEK